MNPAWSAPVRAFLLVGVGALALGGGLCTVAATLAAAGLLLPTPPRLPREWGLIHIGVIALAGAVAAFAPVVDAFAVLVAWLLVHRRWTGRRAGDARVALLLSALTILLACVASVSPALAPLLAAWCVLAPVALLRAQGMRAPRLEAGAAVAAGAAALALFAFLPRLQGGLLQGLREAPGGAAFPDEVALGEELLDADAEELVMRVRAERRDGAAVTGGLYLRGRVLDRFDGARWTATLDQAGAPGTGAWDLRAEVLLEPLAGGVLFGPPDLVALRGVEGGYRRDGGGTFFHRGPPRRMRYEALSRAVPLDGVARAEPAWLQLPDVDPRVRALAEGIAPGVAEPVAVAAALVAHFGDGFAYTQTPPPPRGDPLAWFLLDARTGHCEYYASALAVMLRLRGVPARLATGFHSAERSDAGGYVAVRRGHAHAWVEVVTPRGWAVLDPTPTTALPAPRVSGWRDGIEALTSLWYDVVLDYDLDRQIDALGRVGRLVVPELPGDPVRTRGRQGAAGFVLVAGALLALSIGSRLVLWLLSRPARARAPADMLGRAFSAARRVVRRRGWDLPASLPPLDAAAWLRARAGDGAAPLEDLAWLLYRVRYGGEEIPDAAARARACVRALGELGRAPAHPR